MNRIYLFIPVFLIAFALLSIPESANSQERQANNASVYSFLGLGTPHDYLSHHTSGMSLIGVGVPDRTKASLANPAFWGSTSFTSISAGMNLQSHESSDNFNSSNSALLGFSQFQVQIPVRRDRIGVSLGLFPATQKRFSVLTENETTMPTADSLSVVSYQSAVTGRGGLNRLELGIGFRITNRLYAGYAPSFVFGIEDVDNQILFNNDLFSPVRYINRTRYTGLAHRFGVMYSSGALFGNTDQLVLGATATLPTELNANRRVVGQVFAGQAINDVELISEEEFGTRKVTYPFETTVGLSYFPTRYTLIGAEFHYQQWSEFTSFDGQDDRFMKDRMRLALGFEYDVYSMGNTGLFNSLIYRVGVSYDNGHLNINNTDIETLMFSAGLGIPSRNLGSIDISFDYGIRGTKTNDLVRERIFGVRASLNLSELMFLQRRIN
ncbi:MAG: outer membrane protein transport protein [Balneolales bacterium]|nr:outer membrane protein transport protein [Balneolales bacterium]